MTVAEELFKALDLLLREVELSGNGGARDFGWPKALKASRDAVDRYQKEVLNG